MLRESGEDRLPQFDILLPEEEVGPGAPHVVPGDRVVVPQDVGTVADEPGGVREAGKVLVHDRLHRLKKEPPAQIESLHFFSSSAFTSASLGVT